MTRAPAAQELSPPPAGRLTLWQGTALYIGAVLGTGVIALPALAARAAGPASLLAWLGLVLLSVPLAATFASLGAGYPDGGGISTHVRHAFGARAAAVVGWCFYFAVPAGAQAAGMFAGAYVATAVGGGRRTVVIPDGMGMESRPPSSPKDRDADRAHYLTCDRHGPTTSPCFGDDHPPPSSHLSRAKTDAASVSGAAAAGVGVGRHLVYADLRTPGRGKGREARAQTGDGAERP